MKLITTIWDRINRNNMNDNFNSLQNQVNNISTGDGSLAEVEQARVEEDGTNHATLKERLDAEQNENDDKIGDLNNLNTQNKTSLVEATNDVTSRLEDEENKSRDFNLQAQSPKPPKQGASSTSPKLVIKRGNDYFRIIQKANKGYVDYDFNKGGGTDTASYGGNWDLVRPKTVRHLEDAYVAYVNHTNVIGTLEETISPSQATNGLEKRVLSHDDNTVVETGNISNKNGNVGIGLYQLEDNANPSSVDWVIKAGKQSKANILMWGNSNSSDDIDILVNGIVVKHVDPSSFYQTASEVSLIEFDIPFNKTHDTDITITLRNNSLTGRAYFSCLNFKNLKDYNGEHVDLYKTVATSLYFIDAEGASDYAIKEHNGDWFGSYHGGETREIGRMNFKVPTSPIIRKNSDIGLFNFEDIPENDWCVLDSLTIYQQTDLISKAKMISQFNFDVDGSVDMDFALYDNTVIIDIMYTALTCTHTDFKYITYPTVKEIVDESGITEFDIVEGKVVQRSASRNAELGIRFTKFNDYFYDKKANINAAASYNKFYYGSVSLVGGGVLIPNMNFSKSLDFYVW